MQTLLSCLDRPECRDLIRFDDLFGMLIAPFVDFEYVGPLYDGYVVHKNNPAYYTQLLMMEGQKNNKSGRPNMTKSENSAHIEPKIESIIAACSSALLTVFNRFIN